jgi:hypothetical protein
VWRLSKAVVYCLKAGHEWSHPFASQSIIDSWVALWLSNSNTLRSYDPHGVTTLVFILCLRQLFRREHEAIHLWALLPPPLRGSISHSVKRVRSWWDFHLTLHTPFNHLPYLLRAIKNILQQSLWQVRGVNSWRIYSGTSLFCTAKTCLKAAPMGDTVKGWRWAIRTKGIFGGKLPTYGHNWV